MKKRLSVSIISAVLMALVIALTGCSSEVTEEGNTWEKTAIPWKDYEEARYSIINKGAPSADVVNTIEKTVSDGKTAYQFVSNYIQENGEYRTGAVVSAEKFKPISSFLINRPKGESEKIIELSGVYGEKLEIDAKLGNESKQKSLKLPSVFYDNQTLLQIPRVFPLKEEYSRRIRTCLLTSAAVEPFRIIVVGKEKITVPAGKYECFKVKIQYIGLSGYPNIYAWYTADSSRILVKYEQSKSQFLLKSIKSQK